MIGHAQLSLYISLSIRMHYHIQPIISKFISSLPRKHSSLLATTLGPWSDVSPPRNAAVSAPSRDRRLYKTLFNSTWPT
jgi:hypothetical protein